MRAPYCCAHEHEVNFPPETIILTSNSRLGTMGGGLIPLQGIFFFPNPQQN